MPSGARSQRSQHVPGRSTPALCPDTSVQPLAKSLYHDDLQPGKQQPPPGRNAENASPGLLVVTSWCVLCVAAPTEDRLRYPLSAAPISLKRHIVGGVTEGSVPFQLDRGQGGGELRRPLRIVA